MDDINNICKKYGIQKYTINDDGTINVDGDVSLYHKGILKIPLKFDKVTGYFSCAYNNLTSLDGCPKYVGGDFFCHGNKLTTIEGPDFVGGDFFIDTSMVKNLNKYFEIDTTLAMPMIKNYNDAIKLIKRSNNIKTILKK